MSAMRFEYTLRVVSERNYDLAGMTESVKDALVEAGILHPGDYVENPACGELPDGEFPNGCYRAKVTR